MLTKRELMTVLTSSEFETFLAGIDLKGYREKYRHIKTVEMDLPKQVQAISTLYEVYWTRPELLGFDDFYQEYYTSHAALLQDFQEKVGLCHACFTRGLPARIYRTWASLITQIHAGYVAKDVFGENTVSMSAELDYKKVDFRVDYKNQVIDFQVKKESHRPEARIRRTGGKDERPIIELFYFVPPQEVFDNPYKRDGERKVQYVRFQGNPRLKRFENGFVVFTPAAFEESKDLIDRETQHE